VQSKEDSGGAALINAVMRNIDALNLTADQEARIAALHWSYSIGDTHRDIDAELRAILNDRQLRFLLSSETINGRASLDHVIEKIVNQRIDARVDEKLKSVSVVETELAAAVLNRLIGWAKLFGYFVAIPLGLLLLIFTLFGLKSFEDVRQAANNVNGIIAESRAEIDASRVEMTRNAQQLQANRAQLEQLNRQFGPAQIKAAQAQMARVRQDLETTQAQLRRLLDDARGGAAASSAQLAELRRRLEQDRQQIAALGMTVGRLAAASGMEVTGALPLLPPPAEGRPGRLATAIANCAIAEYNQNVREDGGATQIIEYLKALGFPPDPRIAWSGVFIGYCLKQAGATDQVKPSGANAQMVTSARQNGVWIANDGKTLPQPGDIYFIARRRTTGAFPLMQSGIVWRVFGKDFEGIEGNLNNRLLVKPRTSADPQLEGFARLQDR
jgi:hypothetical protein